MIGPAEEIILGQPAAKWVCLFPGLAPNKPPKVFFFFLLPIGTPIFLVVPTFVGGRFFGLLRALLRLLPPLFPAADAASVAAAVVKARVHQQR
jgi:hypothetical protein